MNITKNIDIITPVENIGGMLFKRDDLYQPFDDLPLNGGKIRQGYRIVSALHDLIKEEYGGRVYSTCSLHSPQGIIITRVCKEFGIEATLFHGRTNFNSITKNSFIRHILNCGGHVNIGCRSGFGNVVTSFINSFELTGYNIGFGINIDKDELLCGDVECQTQNLPDDLDNLVVPVGSGIIAAAVLRGLTLYKKHVKNIHLIQISGHDYRSTIEGLCSGYDIPEYNFYISNDYPYAKAVRHVLADGTELDPIYEGKAYDYMLKYLPQCKADGKTLFWIVGNTSEIRRTKVETMQYTIDERQTISLVR